jgi:hypothetical protein
MLNNHELNFRGGKMERGLRVEPIQSGPQTA